MVSLLGRPDTLVFGEPTAGVPTAGKRLSMSDGAEFWVTAYRYQDRLDRVYDESIRPDQLVLIVPSSEIDAVLVAASDWLLQSDACS